MWIDVTFILGGVSFALPPMKIQSMSYFMVNYTPLADLQVLLAASNAR